MPPSGCYFSRDNKNYRLSGLENNRSSGLPPDRGLHSLRLDTQAVAAPRCSLLPSPLSLSSLSFSLPPLSSYPAVRALFLLVAPLFTVFVPPSSPVVTLSGPSTPFDAPEGPPRSFAPRCPLATSSRPVACLLACLETLFQPQVPACIEPLQPAVHYHFTYYTL